MAASDAGSTACTVGEAIEQREQAARGRGVVQSLVEGLLILDPA